MKQSGQTVISGLTMRGEHRGAVTVSRGELLLKDCDLSLVTIFGSASTVVLQRCLIHRGGTGISIRQHGQATIEDCEVIDHHASRSGRGIWISDGGEARLVRCKVNNNHGGIYVGEGGSVVTESCDILSNSWVGVVIYGGGSFHLSSCNISLNHTGVLVSAGGKGTIEKCHFEGNTWQDWTIEFPSQVHLMKNRRLSPFERWLRKPFF
jgi:parallel beta-helix repeat protein